MSSPAPRLARQDHTQWRGLPLVATWSGNIYKDTLPVSEKSKNRKWQYIVHSKPTLASVSPAHGPVCLCWISALAARPPVTTVSSSQTRSKAKRLAVKPVVAFIVTAGAARGQTNIAVSHPQLFKREGGEKFSKSSRIQLVWYWCLFG